MFGHTLTIARRRTSAEKEEERLLYGSTYLSLSELHAEQRQGLEQDLPRPETFPTSKSDALITKETVIHRHCYLADTLERELEYKQ